MNASFLNTLKKTKDTPLAGDAGNRSYSRVSFNGSKDNYILCKYPEKDSEQLQNFLDIQRLLSENNVNTPTVVESSDLQMLLEDLGDLSLEDHFKSGRNAYKPTIDELIKIQKITTNGKSKAQSFSFTVEKFVWEMNFTLKHFIQLLKINLSAAETQALQSEFLQICKNLCQFEQVITHRDFHSRNVMIKNDKPYIIDFQDSRIGPKFYDLVSLIEDSYTDLSDSTKKDLIQYYCDQTAIKCDNNFMKSYHMQNLQRSFKACGSFASFKNRTNNERYLQYLKPAFKNLLSSCEKVEGFKNFKNFVETSSEEWNQHECA